MSKIEAMSGLPLAKILQIILPNTLSRSSAIYYRSQLFVPGNRPDRFEKACQAGADLVCIDLEDAVAPEEKVSARESALAWLAETDHQNVGLRINAADSPFAKGDVEAIASSGVTLPFVMIPKVSMKKELKALNKTLPKEAGVFFVIIESASGLMNAGDILSHRRAKLALYGAIDFASDVDCDLEWETHLYARSKLVTAAAAHDVQLFDVPHIHLRDLEDCEQTTRQAKLIGIHSRSAIHPAQIARIHAALAPSEEEVAQAEKVIAAYQTSSGNVALLDGKLIETPLVKKAERILAARKV